jgi:hypothetical protein
LSLGKAVLVNLRCDVDSYRGELARVIVEDVEEVLQAWASMR